MLTLTKEHASVYFTKECLEGIKACSSDFSQFFETVVLCCNAALETDEDREHVKDVCDKVWKG